MGIANELGSGAKGRDAVCVCEVGALLRAGIYHLTSKLIHTLMKRLTLKEAKVYTRKS